MTSMSFSAAALVILIVGLQSTSTLGMHCVESDCQTCSSDKVSDGSSCTMCENDRYLHQGTCVSDCPLDTFYLQHPVRGFVCETDANARCTGTSDRISFCDVNRCCDIIDGTADLKFEALCTTTCCDTFCVAPTTSPTMFPTTSAPTMSPTISPSKSSTLPPTSSPSNTPTVPPTTSLPTMAPSMMPTTSTPTAAPTESAPTMSPTVPPTTPTPTMSPSRSPTFSPTYSAPTNVPTTPPTGAPTCKADSPYITCQSDFCCSVENLDFAAYYFICSTTCCGTTCAPTEAPSTSPVTSHPSTSPTPTPTSPPTTPLPSGAPSSSAPTVSPTPAPTQAPTCSADEDGDCDLSGCCTGSELEESVYRLACGTTCCGVTCAPTQSPASSEPTMSPTMAPTCAEDTLELCASVESRCCDIGPGDQLYSDLCSKTCCGVTCAPTSSPTMQPTTSVPSVTPTQSPSTSAPTASPVTSNPSSAPTVTPTSSPATSPPTVSEPTSFPTTGAPSQGPTAAPSFAPSSSPTCELGLLDDPECKAEGLLEKCCAPDEFDQLAYRTIVCPRACCGVTCSPTSSPTSPTFAPTLAPTVTVSPTAMPTDAPSLSPTTSMPTTSVPSTQPSTLPTMQPSTPQPTALPTASSPTVMPSLSPTTSEPTTSPSLSPSTSHPSLSPSVSSPTMSPVSSSPSNAPTVSPSTSPTLPNCNGKVDPSYCSRFTSDNCTDGLGLHAYCFVLCNSCVESTTAPVTTTAPVGSCPTNCGSAALGGGTCDDNGACTSCNSDRVLGSGTINSTTFGRCYQTLSCKAKKIVGGIYDGYSGCSCEDSNCHYCRQTAAAPEECRRCRNGFYLLDEKCVADCPADLTKSGISKWGRECLEPFTCKSGRSLTTNKGCKCAAEGNVKSDCHICEFEAGEYGQKCTRCRNSKFLNPSANTCEDNCDNVPGSVSYQVGTFGAMCTTPFTCEGKRINGGDEKCKCSKAIGGNNCVSCDWTLSDPSNECTQCGNNQYLQDGVCKTECDSNRTASGTLKKGRECI